MSEIKALWRWALDGDASAVTRLLQRTACRDESAAQAIFQMMAAVWAAISTIRFNCTTIEIAIVRADAAEKAIGYVLEGEGSLVALVSTLKRTVVGPDEGENWERAFASMRAFCERMQTFGGWHQEFTEVGLNGLNELALTWYRLSVATTTVEIAHEATWCGTRPTNCDELLEAAEVALAVGMGALQVVSRDELPEAPLGVALGTVRRALHAAGAAQMNPEKEEGYMGLCEIAVRLAEQLMLMILHQRVMDFLSE